MLAVDEAWTLYASGGSTMVEPSTTDHETEGSNPASKDNSTLLHIEKFYCPDPRSQSYKNNSFLNLDSFLVKPRQSA